MLSQELVDKMLRQAPNTFVTRPSFIRGMLDVKEGKKYDDNHEDVIDGLLYTHGRQLAIIIKVDGIVVNDLDDIARAYKTALDGKDIV